VLKKLVSVASMDVLVVSFSLANVT